MQEEFRSALWQADVGMGLGSGSKLGVGKGLLASGRREEGLGGAEGRGQKELVCIGKRVSGMVTVNGEGRTRCCGNM